MGGIVRSVASDRIAAHVGLRPGDEILTIDGQTLRDLIDYRYLVAEESIELLTRTADGERHIAIEKDWAESLGIEFDSPVFDGVRECDSKCAFCFVDQAPDGMRPSSLIRDDDYRLSFLCGNFVTLTNLSTTDMERILELRLSPLYVSVHSTEPAVRARLFRSRSHQAGLDNLRRLAAEGIECHCQIVLCPGVNDGEHLARTISDLAALWPGVRSVGVVPVGLTVHRQGLVPLVPVGADDAELALARIHAVQTECLGAKGTRFVFGADELYLLAGSEFPPEDAYEEYPQLENGVGLCRPFFDELADQLRRLTAASDNRLVIVTGQAAGPLFEMTLASALGGTHPHRVVTVPNDFFGTSVTVAGLLAGRDVLRALRDAEIAGDQAVVLIPDVALDDAGRFIDSVPIDELRAAVGAPVRVARDPADICAALDMPTRRED